MPTITDWLMVIITLLYGIATGFICWANFRSAKASRDQLTEMKREHEEAIRLQIIPFLQIEETAESSYSLELELPLTEEETSDWSMQNTVRFRNLGNGAATNIIYTWGCKATGVSSSEAFPINAIKAGDEYKICLTFDCFKNQIESTTGILRLQFDDMRGYTYTQQFYFSFCVNRIYSGIKEVCSDAPVYTGIMENA